jgi:PAS domain S-box-containing protein
MLTERQRLEAIYTLSRALREQEASAPSILLMALSHCAKALGARCGCVVTFRKDDKLDEVFSYGLQHTDATDDVLWERLISRGLIGFAHHTRRTIVVRDIATDPRWPRMPENSPIPRVGSAISLPLEKNGYMYGVITLIHGEIDAFDEIAIELLQAMTDMLSAAVGNAIVMNAMPKDEGRYQWLFEDAVVPIIITDLDGYIVDVNRKACDFLSYKRHDLLQLPITAIHRMGTGPVGSNRFESLQMGNEVSFRSIAWNSTAAEIPVIVRARRLFFNDNDVIAWVEQDVTTQMELDQLRQDLSAMVYHDLRGPLQAIYGSLSGLGRLLANTQQPKLLDLVQVGIRSTKQLSRMVESLLDIQRLEEGKAVLNTQPTSLHSLLANAAQLVQPLAMEAGQRLAFDLNDELPFVTIDSDMILRVVTNLMENAVKYTPSGGVIQLSAKAVEGGVRITVADSGPGIPKGMQRQIFDKFSRVKYKDAPKGVGLGLAFCRLAVEAHGGHIWVDSEPGNGSQFSFTLPANPQAHAVTA